MRSTRATPRRTRCRSSARASSGCARSTRRSASSRPPWRARGRSRSMSRPSRPGGRSRAGGSCWSSSGWRSPSGRSSLTTLGIIDLGTAPQYLGAAVAGIGLILTIVALWLRRNYRMRGQLRDVEIDRRLRGRSEMEAELKQAQADTEQQLGALGLDDLPAAEDLLRREDEHVARMNQLARPARRSGRQGAARRAGHPARRGRP